MLRKLTIIHWDRLVPLGLIGGGAAVTALAFAADLLRIGDLSGIGPNQFSVALSGFAILVAGVVLISPMGLRPVAEGLLIDDRGSRHGFPPEVVEALLALSRQHSERFGFPPPAVEDWKIGPPR